MDYFRAVPEIQESIQEGRRRLIFNLPTGTDFGFMVSACVFLIIMMRILKAVSEAFRKKMKKRIDIVKAMRATFKDSWRAKNGYSWDMVLVFNIFKATDTNLKPVQVEFNMKRILNDLAEGGVETKLFYNVQKKLVYCKLRVDYKRLKAEADRIDFKMKLDSLAVEATLAEGKSTQDEVIWKPVVIPHDSEQTRYMPCDHVYAPFRYETSSLYLYQRYGEEESVFRGVDRMKLLVSILESRKSDGGCGLDVRKLKHDLAVKDYFFLHDLVELRTLESIFLTFFTLPWNLCVNEIKDYFGEKIGFYFLFLSHYTSYLGIASVLGFACYFVVVSRNDGDPNSWAAIALAILMACWTQMCLEFWKRKQVRHSMEWGMTGYEAEAVTRPEFVGEEMPDPVRGQPYLYFPRHVAVRRQFISTILILISMATVCGTLYGIFALELQLRYADDDVGGVPVGEQSSLVKSVLVAVQVQVFNVLYTSLAHFLNNYENHRTDVQYEDALIAKTFAFQFVNQFAALFYLAFAKPFLQELDSCNKSCMHELAEQLFVLLVSNIVVGNLTEIGVPALMQWLSARGEKKAEEYDFEELTEIEREAFKDSYDESGTFSDYAELMMQIGLTTLFVASFPLAPILSFVGNYVEIRIDAWKLCQLSKRPEPKSAEDIGTWQSILEVMALASVLSNSALIAYTSSMTQDLSWSLRNWIFFSVAGIIMGSKYIIDVIIPDVPKDVEVQLKRAKFVVSKVMYDASDDLEMALEKGVCKADLKVRIIDDDPL